MDRRDFLGQGGAAAVAAVLGLPETQDASAPAAAPEAFRLPGAPVLQNLTPDGVTVFCAVNARSTGWVEFGESPDALDQKASGGGSGLFALEDHAHRVRLSGLKPGTTYHYRVGCAPIDFRDAYHIVRGAPVYSPVYAFRTPGDRHAEETLRFSVLNDTHEKAATLGQLIPLLQTGAPDLTFWNGDIFDDVRSEAQIADRLLCPAGGAPYAAERPLYVARGNHDVRGVMARTLERYIDTPGGLPYFAFRRGPVAFIVLDTGEDKDDTHPVYAGLNDFAAYRSEQRRWLETELRRDSFRKAPFRVVLTHIPLFGFACPGQQDSQTRWHDLLAKARVDLVISGHTHRTAYHAPEPGRPYPILIGGGPQPEQATLIRAEADSKRLEVTVLRPDGSVLARHEYQCNT